MTVISIFNLNIMHGRNSESAIWPLVMSPEKVKGNLFRIVNLVRKYDPDVIAFQEVDKFSLMTGGFNQFDFLKDELNYRFAYFSPSCSIRGIFVSGNAIFSKYPLLNCKSYKFPPTFPTDRMGFVIADLKVAGRNRVTFVSVHTTYLDWLRKDSRWRQLKLLEKVVAERGKRAIISGDMNCDLSDNEEYLKNFVNNLGLQAYQNSKEQLNTHPSWNPQRRIDWVLPSKKFNLLSYKTLTNVVSDHLPVLARVEV